MRPGMRAATGPLPDEEKKLLLSAVQELRKGLPRAWELGVVTTNWTGSRVYLSNARRQYQADIVLPRLFTGMGVAMLRRHRDERDRFAVEVGRLAEVIGGMFSDFAWPDDVRAEVPFLPRARAPRSRVIVEP